MKASEHWRVFRRGVHLLWDLSPAYTVFSVLQAVLDALTPYVPIYFTARLVDALTNRLPRSTLALYAGLTVGLTFLLQLLRAWCQAQTGVAETAFQHNADWKHAEKTMAMAYESIEDRDVALLRERILQETSTGFNYWHLRGRLLSLVGYAVQIGVSISLTASFFALEAIPIWMKLALICGLLLTLAAGAWLKGKAERRKSSLFEKAVDLNLMAGRLSDYESEYATGKDIRLYGMSEGCLRNTEAFQERAYRLQLQTNVPASLLESVGNALDFGLKFGVYLVLLYAALQGEVSVGSIAQYVSCITLLMAAVSGFVSAVQLTMVNNRYLQRYFSYFDLPNNMYKGSLTVEKRDDNEYFVEFRDVSFRYPHSETWALRHVSLKFQIGQKLAVVGLNGSGKTTFIKLLCRLYDPTEGVILLNGVDIRKYDYDEYMSLFSVVFQDFRLFSVSLGQNVAASTDFDPDRVLDCLRRAGFEKREAAMPQGLDTPLYKDFDKSGVEISGGEAQKIALARALYKDAPFIILDEPTAALDPISEYQVYSRFNAIAGDKTAVYISHRLASCRFCDKIAVFEAGQIVQQGTHEALLADAEGQYCALWNAQAQYYRNE